MIEMLVCGGLVLLAAACGTSKAGADTKSGTLAEGEERQARLYLPEASGTLVFEGEGITIDASNASEGYIMVRSEPGEYKLKLRVACGTSSYGYDLPSDGSYIAVPCQMGSGEYLVRVMEHVKDDLYAQLFAQEIEVTIPDPLRPFLYASQYVNFDASSAVVAESNRLAAGLKADDAIVQKLYRFVVGNTTYDYEKAATVEQGYLPSPDETLASGTGICFDYSALLAAMLRAQGIPTRLVVGVVMPEGITHAWNQAYIGGQWVWMDATFDDLNHVETDYIQERVY